ncbi:ubiquinol-cytochrome c reductase iron-sulfur subunit [candidate division CSSED10-310 bacterium]|uniref:Ubiquinol-cytochrome c reductase iron-sulfur subunit n=1 Tax=candidate division CSSED10-310 bacterium TaxID=2855610 RepID=A0ABV6Z4W4_UNCC1
MVGRYISFPLRAKRRIIFPLSEFQNEGVFHQSPVYLIIAEAKIKAVTDVCPHLGCQVNYHRDQEKFVCPCHGSTFDGRGHYLSGPARTDLRSLSWTRTNDQIEVSQK